tara:strand:+ start:49 stop:546 length:498 start_codon:yes stop_codon:yes gene_type:complete
MENKKLLIIIILLGMVFSQDLTEIDNGYSDFQISSQNYLTDQKGNVLMYVNVWGTVINPGRQLVYEGIDLATLLSIVGGPMQGANMKKVRLYREIPDLNQKLTYLIDLESFISTGDRSEFIKIKPNDTILIPQKFSSYVLNQIGTVNTLFSLLNLYFAIESRYNQ